MFSIFGYGQVSLLTETNTKNFEVKEAFKLNIGLELTGNNLEQQTPLKLPDLSKFEILGNASEAFTFIDPETGMMVKQIVHQLILEPKQAGKLKIGSALVQVNGKIYKSEAFDIFVKENNRKNNELFSKDVSLSMEVQNTDKYTFQPIKIILKAHSKNFQNLRKIGQIQLPKYANIHPISLEKQDIEIEEYGDEKASQIIASFILFPENSGNIIIPPALAQLDKEKILSNKLKINVKSLPKNAPHNFTNAVGNFEINIKTPDKIRVNQPFDIFIKLSGEGNLNQISLPKILESDYYTIFQPKKTIKTTPSANGLTGEITEHYVLTPKKEGNIDILIEDFVFFNPQKNTYETINKTHHINSLASNEENSTIEEMIDDTEHILKKVDLSPIPSKKDKKNINWITIFTISIALGVILIIGFYILKFRKKKRATNIQKDKITTIAETEEILRNSIFIGKDYYFRLMKKALEEGNYTLFFEYYDELHCDAEQQIELYENKNINQFLENTINSEFAKDFDNFREKILLEKYAPIHQDLYDFYNNIVKFYSKIMK